jgi:hypothetical protein
MMIVMLTTPFRVHQAALSNPCGRFEILCNYKEYEGSDKNCEQTNLMEVVKADDGQTH